MIYRIGKRKKLNAEINVVPYIDVMLVLLIIFMVLSPLLIQGIEVNLPKTDTTKMSISDEPLVISINESGKYFLNLGEEQLPISLLELKNKAKIIYQANPDIEIVFKSDANVLLRPDMITNIKYLNASLFSFCIHASIFLYLYGTFDRNATQTIFISAPLRVELKFESEIPILKQKINKQIQSATSNKNKIIESSFLESKDPIQSVDEIPFIHSNLSELIDEEKIIELTREQQEISLCREYN